MKLDGNTVLITGGATGIGFALAEAFLEAGSQVIVCSKRTRTSWRRRRKSTPRCLYGNAMFRTGARGTRWYPGCWETIRT